MDINQLGTIIGCNRYLANDDMYELARKRMEDVEVKFIEGNVLSPTITEKYDNIWLSNVGKYIGEKDLRTMVGKMASLLKPDGQMLIDYFYSSEVPYSVQNALSGYDYEQVLISGEPLNTNDNSVLIYKRKL